LVIIRIAIAITLFSAGSWGYIWGIGNVGWLTRALLICGSLLATTPVMNLWLVAGGMTIVAIVIHFFLLHWHNNLQGST
jgi:hypothetical protein